ncbi:unnamed protein product [Porites evermanni]|uniref:ALOG domain-containing protein n=1 Tax=Porites evermanni TaxID=104178 RepID=A0ABN8R650_9CNID|nr:unnamed protein product [Porites evermanni]
MGCSGSPLPPFTPFPTPGSRGVNVFAQDLASQENAYVFPPFILVGPLLRFLDKALFSFTIVVPKLSPLPYWWPVIQARALILIWKPAAPCLDCGYLNDADFNFCQKCGFRQFCSVSQHLAEAKRNKSYERQKSSLHKELVNFLSSLPVPKALPSASPSDIKKFLVWKDNSGKTVVHLLDCPGLGQRQRVSCSCPTRLAAGTVDSLIGKLRSIFVEEGLEGNGTTD